MPSTSSGNPAPTIVAAIERQAESADRLARAMLWLTVATVVLAVVQTVAAVLALLR